MKSLIILASVLYFLNPLGIIADSDLQPLSQWGGKTYFISTEEVDVESAIQSCSALGYKLLGIENEAENRFIKENLQQLFHKDYNVGDIWTSGIAQANSSYVRTFWLNGDYVGSNSGSDYSNRQMEFMDFSKTVHVGHRNQATPDRSSLPRHRRDVVQSPWSSYYNPNAYQPQIEQPAYQYPEPAYQNQQPYQYQPVYANQPAYSNQPSYQNQAPNYYQPQPGYDYNNRLNQVVAPYREGYGYGDRCNCSCDYSKYCDNTPKCTVTLLPCTTGPRHCTHATPVCEASRGNCSSACPPCILEPPRCNVKQGNCTVVTKPCVLLKQPDCRLRVDNCTTTRPPCTTRPGNCLTRTSKVPCPTTPKCMPGGGCYSYTPPCVPQMAPCPEDKNRMCPTQYCPPPVTTCRPPLDCTPIICQSPLTVCQEPTTHCPNPVTFCPPPVIECNDPEIHCPDPHITCEEPKINCTKPIAICPKGVSCPGVITHCSDAKIKCGEPPVFCPPPQIHCTTPRPCVITDPPPLQQPTCPEGYEDCCDPNRKPDDPYRPYGDQPQNDQQYADVQSAAGYQGDQPYSEVQSETGGDSSGHEENVDPIHRVADTGHIHFRCIGLSEKSSFKWDLKHCSEKRRFICEEQIRDE